MTQEVSSLVQGAVELPPNAPRLRITAGSGSATQKTWNIRRPVTLVGSRRPAHIVLHGPSIAQAHCVIVNTGTEFLLKDLHTESGTTCNKVRIDLTVLKDGDVIDVGNMQIQVAVQPAEGPAEPAPADPTTLSSPTTLGLLDSRRAWTLHESVTLIGKLEAAPIRLDSDEVSDRHAVIFRYGSEVGVFDLGGRGGIWVNGTHKPIAILSAGDRITIGPLGLQLGPIDRHATDASAGKSPATNSSGTTTESTASSGQESVRQASSHGNPSPRETQKDDEPVSLDTGLAALKSEIAGAWEKLNTWPTPIWNTETELTALPSSADDRSDETDAAIRGQLHDLQHLRDQLATREKQLAKRTEKLEARENELDTRHQALDVSAKQIEERVEGVTRRERVVAQRWSRLLAATCPNCAHPFASGESSNGSPE